ncbi:clast3-related protein [Populus alba x Populus x berolinensis]|nr:clast3-related protein [Populus alba x Populus x berolinensis]
MLNRSPKIYLLLQVARTNKNSKHFLIKFKSLEGFFVNPALSIWNVGQLAVDLLVSLTRAGRIGYLDDPYILPCAGNDADGPTPCGELAFPLEAYDSRNNGVALVQQRSPVVKNLGDFAVATGMKHVEVLSSLEFMRLQKIDVSSGLQIYDVSCTNTDGTDDSWEWLGRKKWLELILLRGLGLAL